MTISRLSLFKRLNAYCLSIFPASYFQLNHPFNVDSKLKPFVGSKFSHDLIAHEFKHVWFYWKALKSRLPLV